MDLRWMIGEAQAPAGATAVVDRATATAVDRATAVDPATATGVDPATATAVDPATATAAPVLGYRQWCRFGYRQRSVGGNPSLTAGSFRTARGSMGLTPGPSPIARFSRTKMGAVSRFTPDLADALEHEPA